MPRTRLDDHHVNVGQVIETPESTLLDLLDRLLEKGVIATGDVMLGVAGVDLIYLRLSALLGTADRVLPSHSGVARRRKSTRVRGRR